MRGLRRNNVVNTTSMLAVNFNFLAEKFAANEGDV
jgi:hypothetical protein